MSLKDKLKKEGVTTLFLSERLGLSQPTLRKYIDNPEEFRVSHFKKDYQLYPNIRKRGIKQLF